MSLGGPDSGSDYAGPEWKGVSTSESGQRPRDAEAEYAICRQRGHQSDGFVYTSIPPQSKCRWCGTFYHFSERTLVESRPASPSLVSLPDPEQK